MRFMSSLQLDAFGSIYRADEINNLSDELMAELGRDEKALEKLGSQDLTPNEVGMPCSHPLHVPFP